MDASLLDTSRQLLRCGRIVEACLERALRKSDHLSPRVTQVLADTLTKLVQDICGLPLILGQHVSEARAMRCLLTVLHSVLEHVRPETLLTTEQEARAQEEVKAVCARHRLPTICAFYFGILVAEISLAMQELDAALTPPLVLKPRNGRILMRCVRHCFRDMSSSLVCFGFNSLKLTVCMRAMKRGCLPVKRRTKEAIHETLQELTKRARCLAAVNDLHADNIFSALELSRRRPPVATGGPPQFFD